MPFRPLPDNRGLIWVPESRPQAPKKHRCPDCFACQHCADDRCRACRGWPAVQPLATIKPAGEDR